MWRGIERHPPRQRRPAISAPPSSSFAEGQQGYSIVRDFCGHGARPGVPRLAQHSPLRSPRREGYELKAPACSSPWSRWSIWAGPHVKIKSERRMDRGDAGQVRCPPSSNIQSASPPTASRPSRQSPKGLRPAGLTPPDRAGPGADKRKQPDGRDERRPRLHAAPREPAMRRTPRANGSSVREAKALQDYELLELVLFRAIPRRDVKPCGERADRPPSAAFRRRPSAPTAFRA